MSAIKLPKRYKGTNEKYHGRYMVSYSQISTWIDKRGFNTGLPGFHEYMRKYFMGEEYADKGWGQYGSEMEAYITLHNAAPEVIANLDDRTKKEYLDSLNNFDAREKKFLDQIEPLGNFQTEIIIDFGGFILLGYMDDHTDDYLHLRDYKSKSANSRLGLAKDTNYQLDIYALYCKKELDIMPLKADYLVVDRAGGGPCMKGGGRDVLSVGKEIWIMEREITEKRLKETEKLILSTVKDISDYWKTFQKFNK